MRRIQRLTDYNSYLHISRHNTPLANSNEIKLEEFIKISELNYIVGQSSISADDLDDSNRFFCKKFIEDITKIDSSRPAKLSEIYTLVRLFQYLDHQSSEKLKIYDRLEVVKKPSAVFSFYDLSPVIESFKNDK